MADEAAFDAFVVARSQALLRTAYLLVQDEGRAEDLLQTALTKAWFAWKRINTSPEAYVRRVMVTTSASWWRRRWTREMPTADLPERPPSFDHDGPADRQDLWDAIGRLPRRQRAVIVLRCLEDCTEVETAQLLDCSVGIPAVTGSRDGRSEDPVVPPTPTPTETVSATIPDGQFTEVADIDAGDIRGWETKATRTNRQPGLLGATDLSRTVTPASRLDGGDAVVSEFCQGNPDTWYALSYGEGGRRWGRCSPDDSLPVRPEFPYIGPFAGERAGPDQTSIRMFVTKPSQDWVDCYTDGRAECEATVPPLQPLDSTDAAFGFVVLEHPAAPSVLDVLGTSLEALSVTADGDEYLVESAVVAEAGASTLVVRLDPSDRVRLVAAYGVETPSADQCRERHDAEGLLQEPDLRSRAELAKLDRLCVAELDLRVDGQPSGLDDALTFHRSLPTAIVPAGGAHEVTVNVVRKDPRNVRFALVLWQARS